MSRYTETVSILSEDERGFRDVQVSVPVADHCETCMLQISGGPRCVRHDTAYRVVTAQRSSRWTEERFARAEATAISAGGVPAEIWYRGQLLARYDRGVEADIKKAAGQ